MATVNFLYRSIKQNEPLNIRLLFRHEEVDYTQGAKSKLYIYTFDELAQNEKLSAKNYWTKLHNKKNVRDIDLENKQSDINNELNKLKNHVLNAFDKENPTNVINNKDWLKDIVDLYYNPIVESKIPTDLIGFIEYYVDKKGDNMKEHRIRSINVTKHKLQKLENRFNKKYLLADVNEEFKSEFVKYANEQSYAPNTQARDLSSIKMLCRYARYLGLNIHHQMDSLKIKGNPTNHIYLNEAEIKAIADLDIEQEYLENARDWLLISCGTGQRVSDFMRFNSSMIRTENGKHLLEFKQVKTQKLMTIPLSKEVRQVLNKRNGEFPRALSAQRYNDYIKTVCKLAGINEISKGKRRISIAPEGVKTTKNDYRDVVGKFEKWELVSSHIGRRSFATNYYGKIPTTFLINITGHSSEQMFLNYIKKSNKDIALESYDYFN